MVNLIHINKILSQLPPAVVQAWQPHFESVNLEPGQILCEPGRPLGHLYFPLTAIVSWIYVLENGSTTEVAMTGREGVVGIYLLMGDTHTNNRALVQKGGSAIRIKLHVVLDSMLAGHPVQALFLRYVRAFISHMTQVSVCHRHHTLEQQLSCMFLLTLDRQDDNDMAMTHEMLANLLGVRREGRICCLEPSHTERAGGHEQAAHAQQLHEITTMRVERTDGGRRHLGRLGRRGHPRQSRLGAHRVASAAALMAARMRGYVPHRQMWPFMAVSISASLGVLFFASSVAACMIWPL